MRYVGLLLCCLLMLVGAVAQAAPAAAVTAWGNFGLRLGECPPANLVKPLGGQLASTATLFSFRPDKPVASFNAYLVQVTRKERVACYIGALAQTASKGEAQRLASDVIATVRKTHGEPLVARFPNDATAPYHELEYPAAVVFTYIEPLNGATPETSKWQVTWGLYDVKSDPADRPGYPPGGPVSKVDGAFGLSLGAVLDPAKLVSVPDDPDTYALLPPLPQKNDYASYLVALTPRTHRIRSIYAISPKLPKPADATTLAKNVLAAVSYKHGAPDSTRHTETLGDTTLIYGTVEITCVSPPTKDAVVILDYTDVRLEDLAACERAALAAAPGNPAKVNPAGL